jgi:hypothetical protein
MTVNTKTVAGRRALRFESCNDLLAEVERLGTVQVRLLGNWSLGQIFAHLARVMVCSIEGFPFKANPFVRFIAKVFFKKKFLTKPLPAGFQAPASAGALMPGETSTEAGLAEMRSAIARCQQETERVKHPFLGELTLAEWEMFYLRHAEMHLSFVLPREA